MSDNQVSVPRDRILEESRLKLAIARDHLDALSRFGLNTDWLNQFEQEIDEAQNVPSFNEQQAQLKSLTVAKDAKLAECRQWGRELRLRMELAYDKNNNPPIPFPSKDWTQSERSETKAIALLPRLIKIATTQAEALAKAGQTQADIDKGQQLLQDLNDANQAQEEYNLLRTQETAQRRALYRQLYDSVNRINQIGQMVYRDDAANNRIFRSNWYQGSSADTDPEDSIELPEPPPEPEAP